MDINQQIKEYIESYEGMRPEIKLIFSEGVGWLKHQATEIERLTKYEKLYNDLNQAYEQDQEKHGWKDGKPPNQLFSEIQEVSKRDETEA